MKDRNICVSDGHIWAKAALHLKAAVGYDYRSIASKIELDLLKTAVLSSQKRQRF